MRNARQLRALVDAAYPEFERLVQTAPTSSSSDEPNFDAPSKKNNYHCNGYTSDVEELACLWRIANSMYKNWTNRENISISVESSGKTHELISEICLRTQNMLSGVASDYDMKSMVAGIVVMAVASVLAVVMVVPAMGESVLADLAFSAVGLLYGVMMFASSFVEEEHHFWYWVASGWFAALFFKEYVVFLPPPPTPRCIMLTRA